LCTNCNQRYERNPLRVFDCKVANDISVAKGLPKIKDHLCEQCQGDFAQVQQLLDSTATPYSVNDQMVCGLDYYNRTTFEVIAKEGLGSQNAICGGGRYDTLVEEFEGPSTPCFGFAVGVERLVAIIPETQWKDLNTPPDLFIVGLGEEAQKITFRLAHELRHRGFFVERDFGGGSLKSQMRKANKQAARFALIIGENEIKTGNYVLKNMDGGEQVDISAKNLADHLAHHLK